MILEVLANHLTSVGAAREQQWRSALSYRLLLKPTLTPRPVGTVQEFNGKVAQVPSHKTQMFSHAF